MHHSANDFIDDLCVDTNEVSSSTSELTNIRAFHFLILNLCGLMWIFVECLQDITLGYV